MGLDVYLYHKTATGEVSIERDSAMHPTHMFKVGYFRSSYNPGGINSVMSMAGLPTLYDIFEPGENYEFTPNWHTARERAQAALTQWHDYQAGTAGQYDCMAVHRNVFVDPTTLPGSECEALNLFVKEVSADRSFRSYSNRDGQFHLDGITVCGLIPGKDEIYVITKKTEGGEDWYGQALEIVVETCDWVLQQNPEEFLLHWSG